MTRCSNYRRLIKLDLITALIILQVVNTAAIVLAYGLGKISKVERLLGWLRGRSE